MRTALTREMDRDAAAAANPERIDVWCYCQVRFKIRVQHPLWNGKPMGVCDIERDMIDGDDFESHMDVRDLQKMADAAACIMTPAGYEVDEPHVLAEVI